MNLDKAIQNRRSVRKYKDKKPDWRKIIECIDSARYAPMAGGIYSLKFIFIDEKEIIQKLADAAQQHFIAKAPYVVVVCTNPSMTINSYNQRGIMYCRQQAGAAIQNFLLKIEEKGLATCWVGAFEERLVKEALKIPDNIDVEAIFPIGYEAIKPITRKVKIDLDNILYFNKYKNKKMKTPKTLNT